MKCAALRLVRNVPTAQNQSQHCRVASDVLHVRNRRQTSKFWLCAAFAVTSDFAQPAPADAPCLATCEAVCQSHEEVVWNIAHSRQQSGEIPHAPARWRGWRTAQCPSSSQGSNLKQAPARRKRVGRVRFVDDAHGLAKKRDAAAAAPSFQRMDGGWSPFRHSEWEGGGARGGEERRARLQKSGFFGKIEFGASWLRKKIHFCARGRF
eukprot:gene10964-biopygen22850